MAHIPLQKYILYTTCRPFIPSVVRPLSIQCYDRNPNYHIPGPLCPTKVPYSAACLRSSSHRLVFFFFLPVPPNISSPDRLVYPWRAFLTDLCTQIRFPDVSEMRIFTIMGQKLRDINLILGEFHAYGKLILHLLAPRSTGNKSFPEYQGSWIEK